MSSRIYAVFLAMYPPELRRDFGEEMADVFAEDLAEARRCGGAIAVIRVWLCAVSEFFRIALPTHAANPAIAVPLLSFALSMALLSGELVLAFHQAITAGVRGPTFSEATAWVVLGPGLVSALTSFVVVRTGARSLPEPLEL
jgi:hypothetical protein